MLRSLSVLALIAALAGAAPSAAAQGSEDSVPPVTNPVTVSAMIRNAGYSVSAEEAAYLDADEQLTDQFVRAMLTAELHAATINDDYSRQLVLAELRRVVALDPAAGTPPAPPTLAELNRVSLARRTAIRQTARQWIEGLNANDPNWGARGSDAYGAARVAESDWYNLLRQIFTARPPAGPGPQ
jgi:hypothetical protein